MTKQQQLDPLTERQEEILKWIAQHIDLHGFQPSIREVGERFRIRSPNGVVCHLKAMERKGYLSLNSMTARGISFNWKEYV
jgi:repressor LexA